MRTYTPARGTALPLGATRTPHGVNFVARSRHATAVHLVLATEDGTLLAELPLDPRAHRTGDHWHVHVAELPGTFQYGWRVEGPTEPPHRFDPTRLLLDPTCRLVAGWEWVRTPSGTGRLSLFTDAPPFDWGDDTPPRTPLEDSIVYEVHVRGFTRHASADVNHPGTYRGLIEKLPYLKWLGITAIELLPVHEFDETDCTFVDPETNIRHVNLWGYNTLAFNAPKATFASNSSGHHPIYEFCELVKAAHAHGIEIWLDVVYNHTGEGDDRGQTSSLRGFDPALAYHLDADGKPLNYSGCGNTLNCNHPSIRELILDSLRYWVATMRVDGFRFDLASIMARDQAGGLSATPPLLEAIVADGVLADTKLVVEPWDAAGAYQVGCFPYGERFSEWNGKYRDDVRRFWRGDGDTLAPLASRLCGSADLYAAAGRAPRHSLNFVTCHDGFTLYDLVSYNHKHNMRNGEGDRDGTNDNLSWNSGIEGPTQDGEVIKLRERRAKGMLTILMVSQGVPMILAGDEFLRTQHGNNNAWCQDNAISWVDWGLAGSNAGFLQFARELVWLRRRHPAFRRREFLAGRLGTAVPHADIHWHGREPFLPNFGPESKLLAWSLDGRYIGPNGDANPDADVDFYFAVNVQATPTTVTVPPSPTGRRWRKLIDTAAAPPRDFRPEGEGEIVAAGAKVVVAPFAVVALISDP